MYVNVCTNACFCLSFSEKLFMQMADRIAEDGFQKAGYEYVCIDVSQYKAGFFAEHDLAALELCCWT